ncbi:hypothetical protein [Nocardiopsis composta]|uniref:Uncharacterized protein n=1 Tax=Nocardiopsis composta TaxID=157465 RepID=A0A7W8VDC1_9ACTN|nr:hypothetical protein [Nocardiopsis composta]MBB5432341.1 hypothetical protein [Nocardiopsis composta]
MIPQHPRTRVFAAGLALTLFAGACSGGGDEEPSREIDTSSDAYTEYSGVALPQGIEDPKIAAEYDEFDSPVYNVEFSGSPEQAEEVCEGIGNWLPRVDGVSEEEREQFGISAEALEAAGEDVRGCSALDMETGVQNEGIVLYPDGGTADVYLRSYDLPR